MYLIHSNGHSATRWISKNLSIDNFSKCYHSTDLIDLNPKIHNLIEYHEFLSSLEKKNNCIYGSIHLPFNLSKNDYDLLIEMGVNQFLLVRNPIFKINSIMQFYLEKFLVYGLFTNKKKVFKDKFNNLNLTIDELFIFCGDNINKLFNKYKKSKHDYHFKYFVETLKIRINRILFNENIIENPLNNKKNIEFISCVLINLFLFALSQCIRFDENIENFPYEKILIYEKITSSKEHFIEYSKRFNKDLNEKNLNLFDFNKKIGINLKKQNGSKFWPDSFFSLLLEKIDQKNLSKYYNNLGYNF